MIRWALLQCGARIFINIIQRITEMCIKRIQLYLKMKEKTEQNLASIYFFAKVTKKK